MRKLVRTASGVAIACAFAVSVAAQGGTGTEGAGQGTTGTQQEGTAGTTGAWDEQQRDQDRERTEAARGQEVTLTGCLQGAPGNWMLTQATMTRGPAAAPGQTAQQQPGTTPGVTPGTAERPETERDPVGTAGVGQAQQQTFRLIAEGEQKERLQDKVGSRVEVRGRLDRAAPGQTGMQPGHTGAQPGHTGTEPGQTGTQTGTQHGTEGQATQPAQPGTQPGTQPGVGTAGTAAAAQQVRVESVREIAGECPPAAGAQPQRQY